MFSSDDYMKIIHEIKNSITLINSSMQLMAQKYPDLNTLEYWSDCIDETRYLKNLILELSDERSNEHFNLVPTNLPDFITPIAMGPALNFISANSNCEYSVELADDLPLINADPTRLRQAIINLLKNAYEAICGQGKISVNVHASKDLVNIDIIDNGCGLPTGDPDNITDMFVTHKPCGTGLGLSITSAIIAAHNGTLTYHNNTDGIGCTFSIQLPALIK